MERFKDTIAALEVVAATQRSESKLPELNKALTEYEDLLYSLMEFMDDCDSILRSLFDSSKEFKSDRHVRSYNKEVSAYRLVSASW
jgi:hypothetical protein